MDLPPSTCHTCSRFDLATQIRHLATHSIFHFIIAALNFLLFDFTFNSMFTFSSCSSLPSTSNEYYLFITIWFSQASCYYFALTLQPQIFQLVVYVYFFELLILVDIYKVYIQYMYNMYVCIFCVCSCMIPLLVVTMLTEQLESNEAQQRLAMKL